MQNNINDNLSKESNIYLCQKYNKWIKINEELKDDVPFYTDIIRCSKCRSYAFLNFIHEEMGDYYGPGIHNNCEGRYIYLCTKRKEHIIPVTEDDE